MKCTTPFVRAGVPFGCGQCMPCRINRARLWSHRIQLESFKHAESSFLTLTYAPDTYPANGSLDPRTCTQWLYRLRRAVRPLRFRYFLVGEYGTLSGRAHYHCAMFGLGMCFERAFISTWGLGFVHVGELNANTATYISGYVTKKLTCRQDPRLNGRHPEFSRMSLRPGIGAGAMADVANSLSDREGSALIARDGDVPAVLDHGRKRLPLGRYLRSKLREEMGFETTGAQEAPFNRYKEEMQALQRASPHSPSHPAIDWPKIDQALARHKLFRKKESI